MTERGATPRANAAAAVGGIDAAWWRGRRVFITGHTGFKGAWLCLLLDHLGASVTGYAAGRVSDPCLYDAANVKRCVAHVDGDVRDFDSLCAAIQKAQPEVVIHMAAQALVRPSYSDPVGTYATNVMGTVHLLEAVRRVPGVRGVVNVTTDKCYDNREWAWGYREDDPMGGHDPYSSSKGCAELVTAAFRKSFFTPGGDTGASDRALPAVASARAGNVIGGGDWAADRLIPDCMRALAARRAVAVRNPNAIRPWQLVLEPLSGYLLLAERLAEHGHTFAQGWNFGPWDDDARPVSWIADRVTQLWGDGASWRVDGGEHPHEAYYLKLDTSKARAALGWRPRMRLGETLAWVVDWHKRFARGEDPHTICRTQIETYLSLGDNAGDEPTPAVPKSMEARLG